MAYCGPRGIPHSHFLGGPARWTEADRDKALAWQDHQAQIHPPCGTNPADWDPQQGGSADAWTYEQTLCPGCERLEQAQRQLEKDQQDLPVAGMYLARKRPDPPDPA